MPNGGVWYAEGTRNLLSDKKELLSFSFPSLEGSPVGVFSGKTISIKVPSGTDLNVLTPSFTHSNDATVTVGSVKQISGVTANNYSNAVTYVVTAQDGTTANYTVRVTTFASVSELQKSIHVYPNPTNQWVHIQTDLHLENIRVLNIHGTQQSVTLENGAIDLATLAQGIYFITFDTPAGTVVKRINKL